MMEHREAQYGARKSAEAGFERPIERPIELAPDLIGTERRLQRNIYVVVVLAVTSGWAFGGLRMALGVALGSSLSLLNERWLRSSVGAILGSAAREGERRARFTSAKFILRYLVVAAGVGLGLWSGYFDILGIGVGLASFVGAAMIEAGYQLYLSFKPKNEEHA
jgi:hypothetical protein